MIDIPDRPAVVETRPAEPKHNEGVAPWERPEWEAHRRKVLASKLHADLKAFVATCGAVADEAFRLAGELDECPAGESPVSPHPYCSPEDDYTDEVSANLCALARVLISMTDCLESDL